MFASSSYLSMIQTVVRHADNSGDWVVIVTTNQLERSLQALLTTVRPRTSSFGGQTLLCKGGGRVTVLTTDQKIAGNGYLVLFLGFDSNLTPKDQIAFHQWRQDAIGTLALGEHPGEMKVLRL